MTPIVFSDLDDTLFQTLRKCPDEGDGLKVMSTLLDGSPSGYSTPRQQAMLAWLSSGRLIPVTARSTVVLARVDIAQAPAICSNGGCIVLENGGLDLLWHDRLAEQARCDHAVHDVHRSLTETLDDEMFRHWVVAENGLPLYVVIKSNAGSTGELAELAEHHRALVPTGWRRHVNGNNLAYMPGWLNKRHAVGYMIGKIRAAEPDRPILGVGDSLSDVGFMDLCDFAIAPTGSQFWRAATSNSDWLS
ncbi:sucrose-6-phosphate hydrolase [Sphingomonas sp. PAMC26645]|uniref:sucrose-6-phosphate hydrolase n=1 Tax=Sphingomonas sp. PAMC26645 TaxID=2565555 RepID=UPI001B3462A6|nr:sucrose-6-phosphate hydrolase [Sphingomonas sp. PAMC26645]